VPKEKSADSDPVRFRLRRALAGLSVLPVWEALGRLLPKAYQHGISRTQHPDLSIEKDLSPTNRYRLLQNHLHLEDHLYLLLRPISKKASLSRSRNRLWVTRWRKYPVRRVL
jgi:hypothetical protein